MSNSDAPIDWGAWLDANGARLLLYARQQTPTCADAEDVLQDALLQLVRTVECGEFHGGQEQWLAYTLTAIRHLAADEASLPIGRGERIKGISSQSAKAVCPYVLWD